MNHIEILKKAIMNPPPSAERFNFHLVCFTKRIGFIDYVYFDASNSWRQYSGNYEKKFSIPLDQNIIKKTIAIYILLNNISTFKAYILSEE